MIYALSIPQDRIEICEIDWEDAHLDFECFSIGCGTAEYEFPTDVARNKAMELAGRPEDPDDLVTPFEFERE